MKTCSRRCTSATCISLRVAVASIRPPLVAGVAGWALAVSPTTVVLALLFSVVVGVVFGVIPARAAALLQPVDALRFE